MSKKLNFNFMRSKGSFEKFLWLFNSRSLIINCKLDHLSSLSPSQMESKNTKQIGSNLPLLVLYQIRFCVGALPRKLISCVTSGVTSIPTTNKLEKFLTSYFSIARILFKDLIGNRTNKVKSFSFILVYRVCFRQSSSCKLALMC